MIAKTKLFHTVINFNNLVFFSIRSKVQGSQRRIFFILLLAPFPNCYFLQQIALKHAVESQKEYYIYFLNSSCQYIKTSGCFDLCKVKFLYLLKIFYLCMKTFFANFYTLLYQCISFQFINIKATYLILFCPKILFPSEDLFFDVCLTCSYYIIHSS